MADVTVPFEDGDVFVVLSNYEAGRILCDLEAYSAIRGRMSGRGFLRGPLRDAGVRPIPHPEDEI